MDDFSDTSKGLKPIAPTQVLIVPEQCEELATKPNFEQRKRFVVKSVFLVFLSIFLLVAALYFGVWIIHTRIQSIAQSMEDVNANDISSHDPMEGRSFHQEPWLSDEPSNYLNVKNDIEDTDLLSKANNDNLEGKERIKEEMSSDSRLNRPEVKIDMKTLLMRNAEKVEKRILDRFEGFMNTTKSAKIDMSTWLMRNAEKAQHWIQDRFEGIMNTTKSSNDITTNIVKNDVLDSIVQMQGVQGSRENNHQNILGVYFKVKNKCKT